MDKKYTCLSVFSGALGFDIGIERTERFRLVGCLENQSIFCETIRKNRDAGRVGDPSMPVIEQDIRETDPTDVLRDCGLRPGELDLLVGGPPCQAFSSAGRRKSVEDARGELLWEFLRYVETLRPKFFLMENVRGLTSAALRHRRISERPAKGGLPLTPEEEPGSVLQVWVDDLRGATEDEYRVDCFEVNAVNYGAPQLRERALFFGSRLGLLMDFPPPTHGPPENTMDRTLFSEGLKPHSTLRDAIGNLREDEPVLMDFSPRKKRYLAMVPPGGNWRSLPEEVQRESMGRAWHAKGGRSGWWRRLSWDLPCPTITTMPNHASTAMCHPDEVRVLSARECAAIQEFPDDWEFIGTTQQQYEQVGNAVPVRLGEVAGNVVAEYLDMSEQAPTGEVDTLDSRAPALFAPPFRKVYLKSHVRTRQWYKEGQVYVWEDGEDNGHATYSARRRRQKR